MAMDPNSKLNTNIRTYVNSYIKARNSGNSNSIIPVNTRLIGNLKHYINNKRPKVAGTTAAAIRNANGTTRAAASGALAAAQTPPNAPAERAGLNAANAVRRQGGGPNAQAAGAAAAAQNHALAAGATPLAANNAAARAAANAAAAATQAPQLAINAAANGAAAANVPVSENLGVESGQGINLSSLHGAINQNTNSFNLSRARSEKLRLQVLLRKIGGLNKLNQNTRNRVNAYNRKLSVKLISPNIIGIVNRVKQSTNLSNRSNVNINTNYQKLQNALRNANAHAKTIIIPAYTKIVTERNRRATEARTRGESLLRQANQSGKQPFSLGN
jgi:hypothetical protein